MSILIYSAIFLPMTAAVVCYAVGRSHKAARDYLADVITGMTLILCLCLAVESIGRNETAVLVEIPYVCGMGLHFTLDGFRALYGTIAALMWFMSTLFSKEYFAHYHNRNRYYLFLLLTLGATEGVFFSADFYTTFIFFEIMSLTSYVWVAHDERKESLRAAGTYLAVAVIGGLVMLMGIFLLYDATGTLYFDDLSGILKKGSTSPAQIWIAGLCLLFGFGAKAGAFPLHIWLPKAHPVAPAPASALLSGILTKAGMYGILILTAYLFLGSVLWGGLILIIGVCTMVIGALLALLSMDLKRTLACSSVSQIGFILVGVGMSGLLGRDNALAMRGSMLHMVNHSLIKLVLFMAAGVVFMNVHKLDLNEIRGFGHRKPLLNFIFLMGALGIGGVPLWNGYISKTLIHESIVEYISLLRSQTPTVLFSASFMKGVEWIFLISGGLTIAYMAKLYVCLFLEKNTNSAIQEKYDHMGTCYMNKISASVLAVSASLLPLMGFFPGVIMDGMADMGQAFLQTTALEEAMSYFSLTNLSGAAVSLLIGTALYFVVVRLMLMKRTGADSSTRIYVNRLPHWMDLEELLYRPVLLKILPFAFGLICRILDSLIDTIVVILRKTLYRDSKLPHELPQGTVLTHTFACIATCFQWIGNHTIHRKHPRNQDFDHKFALFYEELNENSMMIARSMSFGLLLFCVGLVLTVAYLFIKDVFGL